MGVRDGPKKGKKKEKKRKRVGEKKRESYTLFPCVLVPERTKLQPMLGLQSGTA